MVFVKSLKYLVSSTGKSVGFIGGIHGNEVCGNLAITRLINDIDSKYIVLTQGSLNLLPIANPKAYEQNVRFIDRNLNRYLYPKETKSAYEDYLDPIICSFIDQSDIILDIHSYGSYGESFIIFDSMSKEEAHFAKSIGIEYFVYGWQEAFGAPNSLEAQGTTEYAHLNGAIALTIECGNHLDSNSPKVAYDTMLMTLDYFDMLDSQCEASKYCKQIKQNFMNKINQQKSIKMTSVFYREHNSRLAKEWNHLEFVHHNESLYSIENKIIKAPADGYVILPKHNAQVGDEWFYFGVSTDFPI